ncbi:MAG TPA: ABC transporter permease [Acidimicrobiales bacterium]|nr:ABC transporter permease [Acidimicrobiales bacterium]
MSSEQLVRQREVPPAPLFGMNEPGEAELAPTGTLPGDRVRLRTVSGDERRRAGVPVPVRRAILPIVIVLLWWAGSSWGWWSNEVLPSPVNVAETFGHLIQNGTLLPNLWVSLRRVLIGSAIGVSAGTVLGVIVGLWRLPEQLFDSTLQMARTLPYLVMLPLFILWFGVDEMPKILIIAIGTSLPMYLNTSSAVRDVDPRYVEMGATFGLSRPALIAFVILPSATPAVLSGLRFSLGLGWLSLVVAEQINAQSGLGLLISNAQQLFETNVLMVCVLIYAVLGLVTDILVRRLEKWLLVWRGPVTQW